MSVDVVEVEINMSVDVTEVKIKVEVVEVEVETEMSVDVVEVKMFSGVEVGICSLFIWSEKETGGIFAVAKVEAVKLSRVLLNKLSER